MLCMYIISIRAFNNTIADFTILPHEGYGKQDKVNYAVSEREDRETDLTMLIRMTGCTGMYWAVLGSSGVLDLTRLHWDLIGWGGYWSGGSGGPVIQVVQLVQVVQVARMISIDDMHSENIWLSWSKSSIY